MTWESDGKTEREAGHDILTLARAGDAWTIVWRTLVAAPA
jgi:hypothetical protein